MLSERSNILDVFFYLISMCSREIHVYLLDVVCCQKSKGVLDQRGSTSDWKKAARSLLKQRYQRKESESEEEEYQCEWRKGILVTVAKQHRLKDFSFLFATTLLSFLRFLGCHNDILLAKVVV